AAMAWTPCTVVPLRCASSPRGGTGPAARPAAGRRAPVIFGFCVLLALVPSLGRADCVSEERCATEICLFSDPATWTDASCGTSPGYPGPDSAWQILAGHSVIYNADGLTVGPGSISGTLSFDPSSLGRDG